MWSPVSDGSAEATCAVGHIDLYPHKFRKFDSSALLMIDDM